ncbi:MAG: hypothetical protein NTW32_22825 [Chloroflexi bacterium]|nr:hypothetical protein [Chloroflexota bacterium]
MKNRTLISFLMLGLISLACSLPTLGLPAGQTPSETPQQSLPGNATGQTPGETPQTTPIFQLPGKTPDSKPVSISDGLASLNSYRTILSFTTSGPNPNNSSTVSFETQLSKDKDAQFTSLTSKSIIDGQPSEGDSPSVIYRIGSDQCSGSGEDWSFESLISNEAEMRDIIMSMFSFSPAIDNPLFVAPETVNGVSTNHFSFKVKGLGAKSGANVTINQGDYWLAVDGQYLVKYLLVVETVVDPKTNVIHTEINFEVKDINQSVEISFPQTCLDAAKVTPTSTSQVDQQAPAENPSATPNALITAELSKFAGFWDTNNGVLTCGVDGQKVNCIYTLNSGKIAGMLSPDGRTIEGTWSSAPTYQAPTDGGRVTISLTADNNSITGQWWHGQDGAGGTWIGSRK